MLKRVAFLLVLVVVLGTLLVGCGRKEPVVEKPDLLLPDYAWVDSGATGLAVPDSPSGVKFSKLYTYSDGSKLYIQVVYDKIGYGQNFWLLIDDTAINSGYDPSGWDKKWGAWWGNMGMSFKDDFFDPDFIEVRARDWDSEESKLKPTEYVEGGDPGGGGNANAMGSDDENCKNVYATVSDIQSESGKNIVFIIPYSSIGKEQQAKSGDEVRIIVMVGRDVWQWSEQEYLPERPIGMQAMIPNAGEIIDEGKDTARIGVVNGAIAYTLK